MPKTTLVPPAGETVAVTIDGVTQTVKLNAQGVFTLRWSTGQLTKGTYTVAYSYGGDADFATASNSAKALTIH